ncbi:CidA/LrgA family protein [Lactococcus chungangensis]|jgi:Putative effector of murein hydrolase LrgA|uniref:Holin-like protein n=3 Tax=Pseudolactococcus chungangensis TaxID=451457 RepID=A0A1K2H507_9LACT|nr:CidA/LrgA family protein [Lactococcus chungangensis]MDD3016430.1 CidA/LrgA family protein [Lactococcus chungangensis]NCB82449.1 CidA/LrgA family protein [Bacilli bacterium]NLH35067.1 CidA/LrgA family protein [Lactococcus chungangensis]SFZ70320.1 holin-like protein [Lactococcus chungangensis CAU 28 = DSM 22330]
MKIYFQFMYILLFSIIGETLSTVLKLPVPGSIIGMVLLFFALKFRLIRLRQIYDAGQFMIENMTILFLPAGVGIMSHWDAISKYWWQIIVIVLLAIVVNIAVIGFVTQFVKHRFEGDYRK